MSPSQTSSVLHVEVGPRAVTLLLDRPDKRNALDLDLSRALSSALEAHAATPLPVVIRSRVPGMFVAGSDVAQLRSRSTDDSLSRLNGTLFQRLHDHPWPTLAVVDGAALGGGCELALACDFRITSTTALWGLPEVRLGIVPSAGALVRLAQLVGTGLATDLVLTGRRMTGAQAATAGLVSRCVETHELGDALAGLLGDLAEGSSLAQRLAKEAMRVQGDRHRLVDAAAQAICLASADTQDRLQRLLDRRP